MKRVETVYTEDEWIQKYYRNDSIDEDELAGTCWNCMRSEIGNHHKKKHRRGQYLLGI